MKTKLVTVVIVLLLILTGQLQQLSAQRGGDKLISFPILLEQTTTNDHYFLSFFLQRAIKQDSWNRDYKDNQLTGPEPRVIFEGNHDSVVSEPDEFIVDFAFIDEDSTHKLANIKDSDWNYLPDSTGKFTFKSEPALIVYGSGGYKRGYDYTNAMPELSVKKGLYSDIYDTGFDQTMKHFMVPLPPNIFKRSNKIYCRIRLRVNAKNNGIQFKTRPDDKDPFIIDNIKLEKTDQSEYDVYSLIATNIRLDIPYSVIPLNQSRNIPVKTLFQNNSCKASPDIKLQLSATPYPADFEGGIFYNIDIAPLKPYESREIQLENLDILKDFNSYDFDSRFIWGCTLGVKARIGHDLNGPVQYTIEYLRIYHYFDYELLPFVRNNKVGDYLFPGRGISIPAVSSGEFTSNSVAGDDNSFSQGGQIAVKFNLRTDDTLSGYQSLFGYYATGPDDIIFRMHYNSSSDLPGEIVEGTELYAQRTYDENKGKYLTDEYCTAFMKKPVALKPGDYWLSISQLGETGLQLGASDCRMAMATTNYSEKEPYGSKGTCLFIHEKLRQMESHGNNGNMNIFAYNNSLNNDSAWVNFSPNTGNPAYGHHDHSGRGAKNVNEAPYDSIATYARGTWIPMIRPWFGPSKWVSNPETPGEEAIVGIYPNPADRYIIISSNQSIGGRQYVEIVDLMGIVVDSFSYETSAGMITRDVSRLVNGIYFYRLFDGKNSFKGTFIISR